MQKFKDALGETLFVSIFVIFSYFVYLMNQYGYFAAFGLFNSSGYIPLQVQQVIPSTAFTAILFILLFGVGISVLFGFRQIASHTPVLRKLPRRITRVIGFQLSMLVIAAPILIQLSSINKIYFYACLAYIFVIPSPILSFLDKHFDGRKSSAKEIRQQHRLAKLVDFSTNKRTAFLLIYVAILLPYMGYVFGFDQARSQTIFYSTSHSAKTYIVVKDYGNQRVLARVKNRQVLPEFKIETAPSDDYDITLAKLGRLDFQKVNDLNGKDGLLPNF